MAEKEIKGIKKFFEEFKAFEMCIRDRYEGETEASSGHDRCPIHPLGGVEWRAASPTDYCADLSVALHYYNAEDKWKDDRSLLGLSLIHISWFALLLTQRLLPFSIFPKLSGGRTGCAGSLPIPDCLLQWVCG